MTENQKLLLKAHGYEVLDKIKFIKSVDIEPNIQIAYDDVTEEFKINLISTAITNDTFNEFVLLLMERCVLVKKLNDLKGSK